jgi:deoxycytidylate deaminase
MLRSLQTGNRFMKFLKGTEELQGKRYMGEAAREAMKSLCINPDSRCGSVIVKNRDIIGRGFNAPPGRKPLEKCFKDDLPVDIKSDRTCCIHAEQKAIMNALTDYPEKIKDSVIYFIRLDDDNHLIKSGKPYCTICSKMAMDSGIGEFVLWHDEGLCSYETEEYNRLSFQYSEK